ncbi:EamA family transporter [Gluconacetobacter azotocaptans]|uniref:EamA family transporter n=1 Tax=Gluconacetobacter azotocaptans TaxID=142834 RepID=A0A7W4PD59_9PROT|nr:EamA family transporter [Gluconacetobacter azotocaptans]MBB2189403.1 EamA family transporter [Gluconacetobacter azotocaptans]MBM9401202.1 EamA family transporter [Gluconacetobacter azotocaptans]GBQ34485.1 drug/metabolite transporter integral membrane protein [Gluconacetobacter azotocaptans DSM 13594]
MLALLFFAVVLIWGTTWFAIHVQVGVTTPQTAIFWRFLLASLVMGAWLRLSGRWRPVPLRVHGWLASMGACLFSCNFLAIYGSETYLASGTVSVIFSLATLFNTLNQWVFFRHRPGLRSVLGGCIAIAGVGFLTGLTGVGGISPIGTILALTGTFLFSCGNMLSRRAVASGVDLPNAVFRGMVWGCVFLAVRVLAGGSSLAGSTDPAWIGSLLYLAVPGSVVAFLAYLHLVHRIGADRAAYTTILSPVVALAISIVYEGTLWTSGMTTGVILILLGNLVTFAPLGRLGVPTPVRS